MALVRPSPYLGGARGRGHFRELAVLKDLEEGLPAQFAVFHNVFVHNSDGQSDEHCEIDLVIMGPDGRLVLMEVKAGGVEERDGRLYKHYQKQEHDIGRQCLNQYMAMVHRLDASGLRTDLTRCLVLPDHVLQAGQAVSMPNIRIIDAHGYAQLATRIRAMLETAPSGRPMSDVEAIRGFLDNQFQVSPDLSVMGRQLRETTTVLADGLASWVPRISAPSRIVRVQATAGSGKTQLALRLIGDAVAAGRSVLYVCFNRPLADQMIALTSPRAEVVSFHELSLAHYRRRYGEPAIFDTDTFAQVAAAYLADSLSFAPRYDVLVVDEAQDFEHDWLQALFALLREEGSLYMLEDDQQQLYRREPVEIADAVMIRSADNFRSPRAVCQAINALALTREPINSRSPYGGALPAFFSYADDAQLLTQTEHAVRLLMQQGFAPEEIVVLSTHGRQRSALNACSELAGIATRRFTGQYDGAGNACWTEGRLLLESIYRFKGQSARAVVLTELDFTELSPREIALLFVGMTRASMALSMVMASSTEALLSQRLEVPEAAAGKADSIPVSTCT